MFWDTFMNCVRNNPAALQPVVSLIAMYAHLGPFSRKAIAEVNKRLAVLDQPGRRAPRRAGRWAGGDHGGAFALASTLH